MHDPFWAYAMECEGDLPTRRGKLNRVVQQIVQFIHQTGYEEIPYDVIVHVLEDNDIYDDLTQEEQQYITDEVNALA